MRRLPTDRGGKPCPRGRRVDPGRHAVDSHLNQAALHHSRPGAIRVPRRCHDGGIDPSRDSRRNHYVWIRAECIPGYAPEAQSGSYRPTCIPIQIPGSGKIDRGHGILSTRRSVTVVRAEPPAIHGAGAVQYDLIEKRVPTGSRGPGYKGIPTGSLGVGSLAGQACLTTIRGADAEGIQQ